MRLTRTFNAGHDNLYLNKDDVNRLLKGQMLKESSLIVQMENPEREWVGLKDEEMRELEKQFEAERVRTSDEEYLVIYPAAYWQWQRAIEAKLKEKNT